jgi:hypothetical protein
MLYVACAEPQGAVFATFVYVYPATTYPPTPVAYCTLPIAYCLLLALLPIAGSN